SFYKDILETESREIRVREYDLCGFVCPLSKIKATELISNLDEGETIKIILGDIDSLKSVVQELKTRGLKPRFEQEAENRFLLKITK
ncbi:MAG: sulfurtransferase TusA family protein, partial [Candidatus Methanofastidiosia archaeon]